MFFYKQAVLCILLFSSYTATGHRCVCSKNLTDCLNFYQMPADFQTAREKCKEKGGDLMSVRSKVSDEVVGFFLNNLIGHFWIGLYLPEGNCSSNTTLLRGYEWTSGAPSTDFTNWASESTACAPLCVSVSSDRRWVERSCKEKLDGFLCESVQRDLCRGRGSKMVILDNEKCAFGPCEHKCTPFGSVGYTCSCRQRFITNKNDPRRCELYCESAICEALCSRDGSVCWCPAGFVRSGQNCEDIDECESNHGCAHKCTNTIGSYNCACYDPFVLVDGHECTLSPNALEGFHPTLLPGQVLSTPSSNNLLRGSLSTPGEYVGLIIFVVLAVFALVVLLRYLRSRKNVAQECNSPDYAESQESVPK